jgi:hypothetical protein
MNIRQATINDIEVIHGLNRDIQKLHVENFLAFFKGESYNALFVCKQKAVHCRTS